MSKTTALIGIIGVASVWASLSLINDTAEEGDTDNIPAADVRSIIQEQGDRYGYRLPGMDCLVNEFGIRRKVIITSQDVRATVEPGGEDVGAPLNFFLPYFVLDARPEAGDPEYFLIGSTPGTDSVIGWVPLDVAVSWDTRVGARLERRDVPFNVYASPEDLAAAAEDPNSDVLPIARANPTAAWTWMPWPVAETREITIHGQVREAHRLIFMAAVTDATGQGWNGASAASDVTPVDFTRIQSDVRKLDIVFCVDNTASTTTFVPQIRSALKTISRQVTEQYGENDPIDVQFGLVLYRDYVANILYPGGHVTKRFPAERDETGSRYRLSPDVNAFVDQIDGISAAIHGSLDHPEAVYDGMHESVTNTAWRGNALTQRVVVLVGDDPAHEPSDERNPRNLAGHEIVEAANNNAVRIVTVSVGLGRTDEFEALKRRQFAALASGTGEEMYELSSTDAIVTAIRQIVYDTRIRAEVNVRLADGLAAGVAPGELPAYTDLEPERVTEFLELLSTAGYDVSSLEQGDAIPQTGWCLANLDGGEVLTNYVYSSRSELQTLMSELNLLSVALEPDGARKIHELVLSGRVNPASFFRETSDSSSMDQFLMASGVPCTQGILKHSREDIEHMSEEQRLELKKQIIGRYLPLLLNSLSNSRYFNYRDDVEFGWIPEDVFP